MDDHQESARRIIAKVGRDRAEAIIDLLEHGVPSTIKQIHGRHDDAELARVLPLLQAVADCTGEISPLELIDGWEINRQRFATALRAELDSI
jgi:hypothetical protein